jgi:hypothetical protein
MEDHERRDDQADHDHGGDDRTAVLDELAPTP